MPRLLFEKSGAAVWMSHLDLMRVFQRSFKRAGLPLTHTQGFNPRPSVSIALPMPVGMHSQCELLDFDLEKAASCQEIVERLNQVLPCGISVRECYENGGKLKNLAYLRACMTLVYAAGVPENAVEDITKLFAFPSLPVEKKGKNGVTQQDIIPMLKRLELSCLDATHLVITAVVCCQNPTLNPMQLAAAIEHYLPDLTPEAVICLREEIFDTTEAIFR